MTTREKFKRRVIELIHGLPHNEAIEKELQADLSYPEDWKIENEPNYKGLPITIGRVMQAFNKVKPTNVNPFWQLGVEMNDKNINWKLTKENGQECEDDDQSDETIEKLYDLIK